MDTYNKVNWEDSPSTSTPLNAENLNHMDDGIEAVTEAVATIETDVAAANEGLLSKADKATTLAGYGITDAIRNTNDSVKTQNIASGAVASRHIANGAVKFYHIEDEAINTNKLGGQSVTMPKLAGDVAAELNKVKSKQTVQYITDTITSIEDLIALNDVNTVYNGVMSGFSKSFSQNSDATYIGFRMWFVQTSPKEANSYERIISLSDGSMWSAYGSGSNINSRQLSYNKKQVDKLLGEKYDASNVETGTAPITVDGYTKDDFYALNCRYQKVGDYCYITFTANPKVAIDSPLVFSGLPFVAYNTFILAAYTGKNNPIKIEITNNTSYLTITKISGEAFSAGETNTFTIGHRIKS